MDDELTGMTPDEELEPPFLSLQGADGGGYTRINVHVPNYVHGELEWFAGPSFALYGTGAGHPLVLDAADRLLTAANDLTEALWVAAQHKKRSDDDV